jgi:nicotinamide phosphoribosyltransferase
MNKKKHGECKMKTEEKIYARKEDLVLNNINDTDSYKFSHFLLYPDDMEYMESYLESRGGEFDECTLFGLQYIIHKYLSVPITQKMIDEEEADSAAHGEPFNRAGWLHILKKYNGVMPIIIRAIPEGLVVPIKNAIMVVRSVRDPMCAWITNWLETKLSRVWYPSTVAIASREIKKVWKYYLDLSSDDTIAEIGFKHHDFGSRGVACEEQAMLGGAAHLLSFFGSDTIAGVKMANHYYDEKMSGFSIPATEHSTMTIFGEDREEETVIRWINKTLIERQLPPGVPKLSACVGDSWDIFRFTKMICKSRIRELIKNSGGTLVERPDSGNPVETLLKIFSIFEEELPAGEIIVNSKGYKVLPSYFRLIWGDGINRRSMKIILKAITDARWSASNLAFGSGGGLLMDFNRDTQKFAFKCSAAIIGGKMVKVSKNPITDVGKRSKEGKLDLINTNGYETIALSDGLDHHPNSVLVKYFDCGKITYHTTFAECRKRMEIK